MSHNQNHLRPQRRSTKKDSRKSPTAWSVTKYCTPHQKLGRCAGLYKLGRCAGLYKLADLVFGEVCRKSPTAWSVTKYCTPHQKLGRCAGLYKLGRCTRLYKPGHYARHMNENNGQTNDGGEDKPIN